MLAEEETQQQQQQQQQLPAEMDRSHRGYTPVGNEIIIDIGDGDDGLSESPSLERHASMRQIVTEEVQHVASETWLITRLSLTLLWFLGFGTRWIGKLLQLFLYAIFLMPGFIQVGYYYFFSKNIQRSLEYGAHPRNRFDLYRPAVAQTAQMGVEDQVQSGRPVVIFITGGAWVIGYKAWGALLARQLVEQNIIVTCIDYRNFPQGCVGDMVADVSRGIGYVVHNIESWGGDLNKIYLVGQSAGAHLGACALLMQAKEEAKEQAENSLTWKASQMKAYFALSGGYNMSSLMEHFNRRGLYKKMFLRIMEGEESLPKYSPECIVRASSFREAVPFLPPLITLFHGKADYSIPHEASEQFADALRTVCRSVGADKKVEEIYFDDKTHTDLFLQDPMRGGKNDLLAELLKVINEDDEEDKVAMMRPRLVPECLLQLARFVSPF